MSAPISEPIFPIFRAIQWRPQTGPCAKSCDPSNRKRPSGARVGLFRTGRCIYAKSRLPCVLRGVQAMLSWCVSRDPAMIDTEKELI